MESLCFLKMATILVVFHGKGTDARPKRSLLPYNIKKTYFVPNTSYLDRPKREEDLSIRPKLTNSIGEAIIRPKRSIYEHETITDDLLLELIARPKIQQPVESRHSKTHTTNFQKNSFVEQESESGVKSDYDRTLNKITNRIIERLCRESKRNSDKASALCVKARRVSTKAWGNPALPPQS